MNSRKTVAQVLDHSQFLFPFQAQNGHRLVEKNGCQDVKQIEEELAPDGFGGPEDIFFFFVLKAEYASGHKPIRLSIPFPGR